MPSNDPEYQREYKQRHYAEHRQKYIDQAEARRKKLRADVRAVKETPCTDCGERYGYWVMHFDHRNDDRNGELCISQLVSRGARKKVFEEIERCDVVCANCHAERTHQRYLATLA